MKPNSRSLEGVYAEREAKATAALLIAAEARLTKCWEHMKAHPATTREEARMMGYYSGQLINCRRWLLIYASKLEEARKK
jgi:hypothetical protein